MKLKDLQVISAEMNAVARVEGGQLGILYAYPQQMHVRVLDIDYERLVEEKYPDNHWCTPGENPWTEHKFAMWKGKNCDVVVNAKFNYCQE